MPSTRRAKKSTRPTLRTLRKRSKQITHNIVQLEAERAELDEQILRLEGQLKTEHASAKKLLCRGKATTQGRAWATEMQQTNEYITILALKQKPGTKNAYEYAFFEPQNRGEAMCERGAVGNISDAATATAFSRTEGGTDYIQFREQLLTLFPTNHKTAAAFKRQYNASLKKAGADAPELDAAIAYLFRGAGFVVV